jgi:hypothetical protein
MPEPSPANSREPERRVGAGLVMHEMGLISLQVKQVSDGVPALRALIMWVVRYEKLPRHQLESQMIH